jgi:hypothetical protein
VIGSRIRKGRKPTNETIKYVIRRLRCRGCERVHHELPDLLVPYKRYEADCIESALALEHNSDVAADDSTLNRWRLWFAQLWQYWVGCLQAIALRSGNQVEPSSESSLSALQQIGRYVGLRRGWLAKLVRPIVNSHLWVHTRFAFLSVDP